MGGFEDGERYRGQQTQLPLEDSDPPEAKIPVTLPQTKKPSKPSPIYNVHGGGSK